MNANIQNTVSRRQFVKSSCIAVAGSMVAPYVLTSHAAADDPIRVGLIGCGSRGTGAVGNVMAAAKNVQLVALADLFEDEMARSRKELKAMADSGNKANTWAAGTQSGSLAGADMDVPDERCFLGWDAYQKLLAIPDINYVILATPPHFRALHLEAAITAGKNVFMEKPVAVDPTGVRKVLAAAEKAKEKKLGIVAGTQRRHQANYIECIKRIQDGAIGDIVAARAYWLQGEVWYKERKPEWSDMEYQLRDWTYFTWLAGDHIVEQHMHNIDVINWVMGGHPKKAMGMGGRQKRTDPKFGHIYDHFSVEYEYDNGVRMISLCRQSDNCSGRVSEAVVGTNGTSDCNRLIQGENKWRWMGRFRNPYEQEHDDLIASIRRGEPLNEGQQAGESTLTAIMGRESAYCGKELDWESVLESPLDLSPKKYEFGPMPTPEVAIPGIYKFEA